MASKGNITNFVRQTPHKKGVTIKPATKEMQEQFEQIVARAIAECNKPEHKLKVKGHRAKEKKLMQPFEEAYKPVKVELDLNQLFLNLREQAYDRPSAMWEVAAIMGKEAEELLMHSPLDMIWNDGEITEEGKAELEYLGKFFDGNIPPAILESGWST